MLSFALEHATYAKQCRRGGVDCTADLDMTAKIKTRAVTVTHCTEANRIHMSDFQLQHHLPHSLTPRFEVKRLTITSLNVHTQI